MPTLSEAQYAQSLALTRAQKAQQNRDAARIAALVALYYQKRVVVEDPSSVEAWLEAMIPQIINASDRGARSAAIFFEALRQIEAPTASTARATPTLGAVDAGVRKSLMAVGPGDYMNKATQINRLDIPPAARRGLLLDAKKVTTAKIAAATVRHAQAGGRQTIVDNSDRTALGWIRVTRNDPCFFCAMLASRGIHYRAFSEDSFDLSDPRFTGDGNAKVHDECGCSIKPVFADNDPVLDQNATFADMWERWGAGGGDAALRFRRGYEHYKKTGEYLPWEDANEGLRAA